MPNPTRPWEVNRGANRARGLETVAVKSLSSDLRIARRGSYESERGQPLTYPTSPRAHPYGFDEEGTTSTRCEPHLRVPVGARLMPSFCQKDRSRLPCSEIVRWLDDAKAEKIVTIDLAGKSSIGDFMVIATGRSDRHVGAIAEQIGRKLKDRASVACASRGLRRATGSCSTPATSSCTCSATRCVSSITSRRCGRRTGRASRRPPTRRPL